MLAARRLATQSAKLIPQRSFATVVESSGIKVASSSVPSASASVTFLVQAGSRFESKPGVAHALKNYLFKNTNDRSALRIAREAELYGGVLSTSLGREHLAITAEFLKGDEEYFVELLSNVLTSTRFTPHEFNESVLPAVISESAELSHSPSILALDVAHALAFRTGLGASLFASPAGPQLTSEDIKSYASSSFSKAGVSVFGTGIESSELEKLVSKYLSGLQSGSKAHSSASKYHGGESRVLVESHGPQTIFIGYGTSSPLSSELSVLAAHLSANKSIPWNTPSSGVFAGLPEKAQVQTVVLPYSDATLVGWLIQAATAEGVKKAGEVVAKGLKSEIKGEELKKAIKKAKFVASQAVETRAGMSEAIALQSLNGKEASVEAIFKGIDGVSAQAVSSATSKLTKSKPVFVAVGDVNGLPYADEIGL